MTGKAYGAADGYQFHCSNEGLTVSMNLSLMKTVPRPCSRSHYTSVRASLTPCPYPSPLGLPSWGGGCVLLLSPNVQCYTFIPSVRSRFTWYSIYRGQILPPPRNNNKHTVKSRFTVALDLPGYRYLPSPTTPVTRDPTLAFFNDGTK